MLIRHDFQMVRAKLESEIERMIALLDQIDGDPDIEDGDADCSLEEIAGDQSFTEWHTRGRHKIFRGGVEHPRGFSISAMIEDAEDDDEDASIEDCPIGFDPESDFGGEELGELDESEHGRCLEYGVNQTRPSNFP